MAVVETQGLTKRFGALTAVADLDLTVLEGEIFGFLGPNGAGKTTTTRLLLDALRPTAGTVRVLGGTGGDPEVRRRIGVLPADLHFDPRLTGHELFAYLGRLRGDPAQAAVAALCERFDLDAGRRIDELSTGNRRKVGIVAAFAHRPDLLVLDEPTSGLDPIMQEEFHELVRERNADGATVFLSSHLLPEVQEMAGRVGLIRAGHLIEVQSVADLLRARVQHLEVELPEPVPPDAFAGVPGVGDVTVDGRSVRFSVDGPVHPALARAAELRAERLTSHQPDLEDIFLERYRERATDRDPEVGP
ncbi:MAG: ABC transporter ATP-binding protein [Acidimicrobiales bacterium]|nr:ABC transporter ATP-binding protein [Acidimicrobiales bacterium]MCB9371659.1 ABC transporter ATP-binding protein [Microthrixaceae bacterium]